MRFEKLEGRASSGLIRRTALKKTEKKLFVVMYILSASILCNPCFKYFGGYPTIVETVAVLYDVL